MVEDALRSLPAAPVPAELRSRVMRGCATLSAAPKFAFPWLEAAISLMVSTLMTAMGSLILGTSAGDLASAASTRAALYSSRRQSAAHCGGRDRHGDGNPVPDRRASKFSSRKTDPE